MTIDASNTFGLVQYYANLLVKQYVTRAKAVATIEATVTPIIMPQQSVQTITFPTVPVIGSFTLTYDDSGSYITINWNDSTATIQTKIRSLPPGALTGGSAINTFQGAISGGGASTTLFQNILNGGDAFGFNLNQVLVSGTIPGTVLTVTFVGIVPPAALLSVGTSTLLDSSGQPVFPVIAETDLTLPLAVQNGYQILGNNPAVGVQLDVLGKYQGVTRTAAGFMTQITLDDSDFVQLIKMAIARNSSGSSLSDIQNILFSYFPGQISVIDFADMFLNFEISSSIGSNDLLQLFITEGLLPVPMAVGYDIVIYDANPFIFDTNPIGEGFGDATNPTIGGELAYVFMES